MLCQIKPNTTPAGSASERANTIDCCRLFILLFRLILRPLDSGIDYKSEVYADMFYENKQKFLGTLLSPGLFAFIRHRSSLASALQRSSAMWTVDYLDVCGRSIVMSGVSRLRIQVDGVAFLHCHKAKS
jgi:hypothetical protein